MFSVVILFPICPSHHLRGDPRDHDPRVDLPEKEDPHCNSHHQGCESVRQPYVI